MPSSGETDIDEILQSLEPTLKDPIYFFVSLPKEHGFPGDFATLMAVLKPVSTVVEAEGLSFIVQEANLEITHLTETLATNSTENSAISLQPDQLVVERSAPMRMISLTVHSSLTMCGLTAALSRQMANAKISCNVVAGFYHDHMFVDAARAADAMDVLKKMTTDAKVQLAWNC